MCPSDDSSRTLEFDDHFVIMPTVRDYSVDYKKNAQKLVGKPVDPAFEYASNTNPHFLNTTIIKKLVQEEPEQ